MIGKTAVVGLGYIGLPTAVVLASGGVDVVGVDVNPQTIDAVNNGRLPFIEPGLEEALAAAVRSGRLVAVQDMPAADVFIIAVPTPFAAGHVADLGYVETVTKQLATVLTGGELVILESTSPPGTTEQVARWVAEDRPDLDIAGGAVHFAHCPERVLPGRVMTEIVQNDRVIGGLTPEAAAHAEQLYSIFCTGQLVLTDARTAELSKLVENAYRDVNIAFANELSLVCDRLGVDVWELIELTNHHPRVDILAPGPGVGGHCIAVDPWFIVAAAPQEARLIRTAREVNDAKPQFVVDQVVALTAGSDSPRIAVLGLAFKKNIDDLRESPAVEITRRLVDRLSTCSLLVVEPHVSQLPPTLSGLPNVELTLLDEALSSADVVVLLVDHDEFATIEPEALAGKRVYDTRGFLRSPEHARTGR